MWAYWWFPPNTRRSVWRCFICAASQSQWVIMSLHTLSSLTQIWGRRCKSLICYRQIERPLAFRENRPVWIETGDGSTSSRSVLHLAMHNFRCDNGPCVGSCVCVCVCLTFDLSLMVRMCCRPEESSPFSCNVWNAVSIKSSLKMEAAHTSTHPYTQRAINQHLFTEKGKHNSVKRHQPSVVVNHACTQQYWDIGSAFRFITAGTSVVTLHQAAASHSHAKTYKT